MDDGGGGSCQGMKVRNGVVWRLLEWKTRWQETMMERQTRTKMQKAFLHAVEFQISPVVTVESLNLGLDKEVTERLG